MSVAAVVLAAGASLRLGKPKQLVRLGNEMLLERAVRICREAGCAPVIVVLGASADAVREQCKLSDTSVVVNAEWAEGMASSVRTGVHALNASNVDGCVMMTCDMPAVSAHHLKQLIAARETTASSYAGRRGVPAYFPASAFGALMQLRGDEGARALLKEARVVPLDGGELDVDTAEDLRRARELFD